LAAAGLAMRLVIQCSVCGTILTVGTTLCGTCRASGIHNLRLLFECTTCFRLGLSPSCEICSPPLSLDQEEGTPEVNASPTTVSLSESKLEGKSLSRREEESIAVEIIESEEPRKLEAGEKSDFELHMDDLPTAELDDEELRLDDGSDPHLEST